jgi:hypothetical protein
MTILDKVSQKPGIAINAIIGEYTDAERDNIYPSLGQKIVAILVGELELMDYVDVRDNQVTITGKGKKKLEDFTGSLTMEEVEALKL